MVVPVDVSNNTYDDWDGAFVQYIVGKTIYNCKASVGTLTTEFGWQIFRIVRTPTKIQHTYAQNPDGVATNDFIFIAEDHAGYTYS